MTLRRWLLATLVLPLTAQGFTWQRQVLPAGKGPQRLEVDLALLGASRAGLADLRLKDAQGLDVPYVLVPPAKGEQPWRAGRLLPLPANKAASGVELDLGEAVRTGRLRVEGLRAPFLKRFRLEGSGDRQRWTELLASASLFDLPSDGLRLLTVDFPQGAYRYLRLLWDDRSSAPLALPRVVAVQVAGAAAPLTRVRLDFQSRPAEPGASRFALRLPGPGLPLRALLLEVAGDGPVLRQAKVVEPRLQGGGLAPRILGAREIKRAHVGGASAADFRIPIEEPQGAELDIRVDDGNNPALSLTGVQAELEAQPWIYFEAPTEGPLTALCGDPKLARPRYDLEALRDKLPAAAVAPAQWGAALPRPTAAAVGSTDLDAGPGTPMEIGKFRFRRALPRGGPGLTALVLDAHVLAHSRLADLRLLDEAGRQLPYLLEQRDEPLSLGLALAPGRSRGHSSFYALALPQPGLGGAQLALATPARVFQRKVLVREEAADGARLLASADWTHADPATPAPTLVLPLPALAGAEVAVEVEEGDNPALVLESARLLLPTWRLRFFQPAGPVTLCYGQELEAPRYDLALLAERLRDTPAREQELTPEVAQPLAAKAVGMEKLFWVALVGAVAVLLGILARLLRQPVEPSQPSDS